MYLSQLAIKNFKNHRTYEVEFCDGVNCITGFNGSGKTNILDAIYMLSFSKSNFQSIDKNICFENAEFYQVKGNYIQNTLHFDVECLYKNGGRKQIKYNGNHYKKLSDHIGTVPLVIITPQDILLIIEGSEERRRLIDMTIGQLDTFYLEKLTEYYKIIDQRNKLLKQFQEQQHTDLSQLELWNTQLIERGNYIYQKRKEHLDNLSPIVEYIYEQLSNKREPITCVYQSKLHDHTFEELLKQSLNKDLILERTNEGIHKDDLELNMNNQPIKRYGSQGQQKTYIFALKLALHQYLAEKKNINPILLLDDLFEKLDAKRSEQLLIYIAKLKTQVFITDTHDDRAKEILSKMTAETKFISL